MKSLEARSFKANIRHHCTPQRHPAQAERPGLSGVSGAFQLLYGPRQTDGPMAASSCSVCSPRLPKGQMLFSSGTWEECNTCANNWQGIAALTRELPPQTATCFWQNPPLQFPLSCLRRLRGRSAAVENSRASGSPQAF